MRRCSFLITLCLAFTARAQDPDRNVFWLRYVIVEDSSVLVPLRGTYTVELLQRGQWWQYMPPDAPGGFDAEPLRLRPLFGEGHPTFLATPARGMEAPDERLRVVRGTDTMQVYLPNHAGVWKDGIEARCKAMPCERRPPVVLVFRKGLFFGGYPLDANAGESPAALSPATLTAQFDAVWARAAAQGSVVPEHNTDTCRYELQVAPDLDVPGTVNTDAWVLRSPYCGTHLLHFPAQGTQTAYAISGGTAADLGTSAYQGRVAFNIGEEEKQWLDVTALPAGDYTISLLACGNGGTFVLKLR